MFERYTEKARRTIFFARYEASQFGCSYIETEHLLLGVFREDKALANQFLASHSKLEAIRHSITQRGKGGPKVSTSVDLPLSHESKRVLAYGAEESQRMNHQHIGTVHLLLGLLREEKSFAAQLLREQGLTLDLVRQQAQQSETSIAQGQPASIAGLDQWLSEREAPGGIWTVKQKRVANRTAHFAIYANDPLKESEKGQDLAPAEKLLQIQQRIDVIVDETRHRQSRIRESALLFGRRTERARESTPAAPAVQFGRTTAASPAPVYRDHPRRPFLRGSKTLRRLHHRRRCPGMAAGPRF
ncbi:MAG TPA: Clp protease N-terminal domain-containing protein [Bryobacteraceae bacterium]|jgi:ATP-dependent Clp protease ATP-binding subunit ClpA|nr:Clp protease N-terminal domain-containing protein [Bryobacteraceae bacterium]